ncbi:hypothetical protein Bca101_027714 [Brassica carinata]
MRWERIQRQVGLGDSSSGPGKRWGHTCNAVKGGRFVYVFGGCGGDGCLTNQVHVFDNCECSSDDSRNGFYERRKRWSELMIRGVPPSPRDSHSCTAVGDNLFVFGGSDGKHYLNDLHVLDTSSNTWKCLEARGEVPDTREAHSATRIGKYILIFGGCGKVPGLDEEVLYNDLYILDTETITWARAATTGTRPFARDCHTCSTWNRKIIVVGGQHFDGDYLSDVHILDTAIEEGPSARFSAAAACLSPYKAGSFLFVGGCNKNLEPLDDIYYLHTVGVEEARVARRLERLAAREQLKQYCKELKFAMDGGKMRFEARVTESSPFGYSIETQIDGKVLRGVLLSNRHNSSVQTEDPSPTCFDSLMVSRKRPAMSDADCDHREKTQRTLSKDSAGSSQQAGPVDPSEQETVAVSSDDKDQNPPQDIVNEMSTDVGAAAEAGPGGDSSPQKQDEGRVAAEDANAEQ